ncbi:AI-2E family transporter [Roseomonas terrae]|jgi:predicted PurR-regulated permease PerM|uniref:AI-2E family transporter n=1 Tax=Neoroseomonas terrae TaxID=424799 RepID=A0ABS5EG86_9PROT|nr:AI-2E family transporter [Neoroseomonas terrae]MBR0650044.1 AI-2E family transporter [Neoroseomonas terrae]
MSRAQASVLIILILLLALFIFAPEVPLLGFAGLLLAVALNLPATLLMGWTGLPRWISVLVVLLGILLLAVAAGTLAAGPLAEQAGQLAEDLPRSFESFRERLMQNEWGAWFAERMALPDDSATGGMGFAATAASTTLGWLGNAAVILLLGVYLALHPTIYVAGLRALLHPSIDTRAAAALRECGWVLRGWLAGQAFAMVVSGVLTWIGLMLLGVPLAGVLAVLAALLGFIPNIGPVIAAVPAMLLAATISPWLALWVALLYTGVQFIEGNILTPLVQAEMADLPPAALLLAQVLMASFFGLLGVALAAPLAAAGAVVVRRAYAEGWLGREPARDDAG